MTLVVCRIDKAELFIQSDTKAIDDFGSSTEFNLRQNQPLAGLLKTVILHPHVCLSFAGQSQFATQFLKRFMAEDLTLWNTPRLIKELSELHEAARQECEFILCEAINRSPHITVIKSGKTEVDVPNAWIGSQPAFEAYQQAFHAQNKSNPLNERMRAAFRTLIDDPSHPEVGHFHIEAYLDHNISIGDSVFLYEWKAEWDTGSEIFHIEADAWTSLRLGEASYGAYGTSYLRSVSTKRHAIAVHFPHARMGILWCTQIDCEQPRFYRDCDAQQFLDRVWQEHRIAMEGPAIINESEFRFIRSPESIGQAKSAKQ